MAARWFLAPQMTSARIIAQSTISQINAKILNPNQKVVYTHQYIQYSPSNRKEPSWWRERRLIKTTKLLNYCEFLLQLKHYHVPVVELVDTLPWGGSGDLSCAGSSPVGHTKLARHVWYKINKAFAPIYRGKRLIWWLEAVNEWGFEEGIILWRWRGFESDFTRCTILHQKH